MSTINKQSCPTCGQSVNEREITLTQMLVVSLFKVWQHCEKNDRWELKMKEFRSIIGGVAYTKFNEWKFYEPNIVWGPRGTYCFDKQGLRDIFAGRRELCSVVTHNPLNKSYRQTEFSMIDQIPKLQEFLDENKMYIAQYRGKADLKQGTLL